MHKVVKKLFVKAVIAFVFSQILGGVVSEAVNPELYDMFRFYWRQYFALKHVSGKIQKEITRHCERVLELEFKENQTRNSIEVLSIETQPEEKVLLEQQRSFLLWIRNYKNDLDRNITYLEEKKMLYDNEAKRANDIAVEYYWASIEDE